MPMDIIIYGWQFGEIGWKCGILFGGLPLKKEKNVIKEKKVWQKFGVKEKKSYLCTRKREIAMVP